MDPKNKYRIQVTLCMFFKIEQNYCMLLDIKSEDSCSLSTLNIQFIFGT